MGPRLFDHYSTGRSPTCPLSDGGPLWDGDGRVSAGRHCRPRRPRGGHVVEVHGGVLGAVLGVVHLDRGHAAPTLMLRTYERLDLRHISIVLIIF